MIFCVWNSNASQSHCSRYTHISSSILIYLLYYNLYVMYNVLDLSMIICQGHYKIFCLMNTSLDTISFLTQNVAQGDMIKQMLSKKWFNVFLYSNLNSLLFKIHFVYRDPVHLCKFGRYSLPNEIWICFG